MAAFGACLRTREFCLDGGDIHILCNLLILSWTLIGHWRHNQGGVVRVLYGMHTKSIAPDVGYIMFRAGGVGR